MAKHNSTSLAASGHWWIPGTEERVPGKVTFDGTIIRLALPSLLGASSIAGPERFDIPVIHGETTRGRRFTLLNSFYKGWRTNWTSRGFGEACDCKLESTILLSGGHVQSLQTQLYCSSEIQLSTLALWLQEHVFQQDHAAKIVRISHPEPTYGQLPSIDGTILVGSGFTFRGGGVSDMQLQHKPCLLLTTQAGRDFDWWRTTIFQVKHLMSLLFGDVARITSWKLTPIETKGRFSDVKVYFRRSESSEPTINTLAQVLFPFPPMKDAWCNFVDRWLSRTMPMQHARNLYFSEINSPSPFLETRFLPIVRAVECFSRATSDAKYIDDGDYRLIADQLECAMPESVPHDLKSALIARLKYGNEHSLRRRTRSLIDGLAPETQSLFCASPGKFVEGVVATRNYLTHYTDELAPNALNSSALFWATEKLKSMLQILFLKDVGLSEQSIQTAMANSRVTRNRRLWGTLPEAIE